MTFRSGKIAVTAAVVAVVSAAATAFAVAQTPTGSAGMHGQMGAGVQGQEHTMPPPSGMEGGEHSRMMLMMHGAKDGPMHGGAGMHAGRAMMQHGRIAGQPTLPGQDAFGTIQEIVRLLEADPKTDWSKVNIASLREHLIDMNEVTLHAVANERPLDNGIEITVTGAGRTRDAIKRMVPAHAHELAALGWDAKADELPEGVQLTVTSPDANQVAKLKALGFMGIMVQGAHHQAHHLMMAKGEFTH